MFGMGFFEILMVAVVAIIFLGPEKLPKALVDMAKFFKAVKKTIDDAKESLDKEVRLSQIKEEALAYKNSLTQEVQNLTKEINLKELSDLDFKEEKQKDTPKKPLSFQENHLQENQENQQSSSPSLENSNSSLNASNQAQNPSPQKSL